MSCATCTFLYLHDRTAVRNGAGTPQVPRTAVRSGAGTPQVPRTAVRSGTPQVPRTAVRSGAGTPQVPRTAVRSGAENGLLRLRLRVFPGCIIGKLSACIGAPHREGDYGRAFLI